MQKIKMNTKCVICGSQEFQEVYPERLSDNSFSPYAFSARWPRKKMAHCQIVKCLICGAVRSNSVITEREAEVLYKQSYYLYKNVSEYVAQTYFELFKNLVGPLPGDRRVLEIGCGSGSFLKKLVDAGICDVTGIEPCQSAVSKAPDSIRSKIITDVFRPDYFEKNSFSLIAAFHVIDHLYSPDEFLKECLRILVPGGMFIGICHNVEAWPVIFFGEKNPIFDVDHTYFFSPRTLTLLLENSGFKFCKTGSLVNRFPLSFWLRFTPHLNFFNRILPGMLLNQPCSIKAGNMYSLAKKQK